MSLLRSCLLLCLLFGGCAAFSLSFCDDTVCRVSEAICFVCKYWHQDKGTDR